MPRTVIDTPYSFLNLASFLPSAVLVVQFHSLCHMVIFWQCCLLSRPCPTLDTCPVERPVSPEVFLFYWSNPDLAHHSRSRTCIMHLSSAKSILDPWHIPLLVLMTLFLYLLHLPCLHPCLHSLPLVYFIDLVPFLFPPCSISECLLVTVYTPSVKTSSQPIFPWGSGGRGSVWH